MICESGKVVSIDGPWVWVETLQMSACNACSAKAGCGQKMLGSIFAGKRHFTKVSAEGFINKVNVGDQVELGIDEKIMLRGSVWVYLMPLVVTVISALVFSKLHWFASEDLNALLGAGIGFLFSILALRWHSNKNKNNPAYQPVLQRVVSTVSTANDGELSASLAIDISPR